MLGHEQLLAQVNQSQKAVCGLTLSGKVLDQHQGQPLPAATIFLEELNQVAQTDAAGNYHFHDLCPGTYHIKTTYVGFEAIRQEVRLAAPAIRNFKLHPSATALHAIRILGRRESPAPTQATGSLQGRALEQTRGESLGKALEQLSGVTTLNTGPSISKPVIHGLHSNRVLLLNNGVRQEGQQWGAEHAPEIDAAIASRLTVVKGAAGVRYGSDAIGGVVLIEPAPLRDSVGTDAAVNLVGMSNNRLGQVGGVVNHQFKKWPTWSLRVQGTLKKGGNTRTPDYFLKNTAFAEQNFSVGLGYRQESHGIELYYSQFNAAFGLLSASHISNPTDFNRALASPVPLEMANFSYKIDRPYQQINHDLLKLSGYFRTGAAGRFTWMSSFQDNSRAEYDKHLPRNNERAARNKPELDLKLSTFYNELVWEHQPYKDIKGSIGVSGTMQRNQYSGRLYIPNYWNYTGSIFWIERFQKNKWQFEAGTRYDYRSLEPVLYEENVRTEPQITYHNFSGTLGGNYTLNHHLSFHLNAGTAFRSPAANELFSNGLHSGAIEIGDRSLKPETAYNVTATITYQSEKKLNGELSLYYNYIQNFIFATPIPPQLTVKGVYPSFLYTQTNATFKGLDLSVSYQLAEPFSVNAKASLVRAFNLNSNDFLILTPADRFDAQLRYEPAHAKSSFLQLGGMLVRQQTRVPSGPEANPKPSAEYTSTLTLINGDYKDPPPGYFLLQASLGKTFKAGKQPWEVSLSGDNLLNKAYRNYLNRFRYFADEMGRNIVLRVRVPLNFSSK